MAAGLKKKICTLCMIIVLPMLVSGCMLSFRVPLLGRIFPAAIPPLPPQHDDKQKSSAKKIVLESVDGPLRVTLPEAIILALSNNKQFQVDRIKPAIVSTFELEEAALFDPIFQAFGERSRERTDKHTVQQNFNVTSRVSRYLPTGTKVEAEAGSDWNRSMPPSTDPESDWRSYVQVGVTQKLLRGAGVDVNLVNLRKAALDTRISLFELTGLAETLVSDIENAYWDHLSALGQVNINSRSLALARRLVRETQERVAAGQKARSEVYFFQAEASSREQFLIDAKSEVERTRIRLLRMISPPSFDLWNRPVKLLTKPTIPMDSVENLSDHVRLALQMRPDINQARLKEGRGELDVVKTRNGLLPKLDLFIILGRSGYSKTFPKSVSDITAGFGGLDFRAGFDFEIPIGNRKEIAQFDRSVLTVAQQREAIDNLVQLAQEDLLLAYTEIHRARDMMGTAADTVRYNLEKRQAELEKYRLGTSSAYRVAQTERDAVTAELSALRARIDYLKGLTQFYYAEGSLLARRGVGLIAETQKPR